MADKQADGPDRRIPLSWAPSAHARRLATLALGGVALAVLTRRPEFAGLAAPPLVLLATWRADRPGTLRIAIRSPLTRIVEGDDAAVTIEMGGQDGHDAQVSILPAADVAAGPSVAVPAKPAMPAKPAKLAKPARPGERTGPIRPADDDDETVQLKFRPTRWGRRRPGTVEVVLRDRARLAEGKLMVELSAVDTAPQAAALSGAILLSRLPSRLGEHPARAAGEGAEFDGVREFVPGDRQRRINWPATTRHGALHLTTFAAERTQNVVIIADVSFDIGPPGQSTHDLALRGAAGVMARYAASRDRVGLISFGSGLGWIAPGQGRRHLDRLTELLVRGAAADRPETLSRLPRAALPPGALIVAFSPLLNPRFIEAIRDLRERGFSVLIVDVLNGTPEHDATMLSALTARLWQLEQQAMRFSLTQIGVPVAHWDGQAALDEPLAPYLRRPILVRH